MFWKILGIIVLVWLAFALFGAVVEGLFAIAVAGAIVFGLYLLVKAVTSKENRDSTKL